VYSRPVISNEPVGNTRRHPRGKGPSVARSLRALLLLAGGWAAVAACSSSDKGAPPAPQPMLDSGHHQEAGVKFACTNPQDFLSYDGQPTGFVLCANNANGTLWHRTAIQACPSKLPRAYTCTGVGSGTDAGRQLGLCITDADCSATVEGHCQTTQRNGSCSCYPGCKSDADCGTGKVCVCGDPTGQCVPAHCLSDAECGPGKLCLSASDGACGLVFACQAVEDLCAGDRDCKQAPYSQCTFTGMHRECKKPPACGF